MVEVRVKLTTKANIGAEGSKAIYIKPITLQPAPA